jgi:hypothetical protein
MSEIIFFFALFKAASPSPIAQSEIAIKYPVWRSPNNSWTEKAGPGEIIIILINYLLVYCTSVSLIISSPHATLTVVRVLTNPPFRR